MDTESVIKDLASLPPDARREVHELIALLKARRQRRQPRVRRPRALRVEPFIGMWRDRADMADSVAWVRSSRRNEWRETDA
ncbi:MAG: DUF2281 domain-containing protein [Armatimonadetes bacterium]|nr:DUF2281 domain-containing protein [Armatimonadota bacterium]